MTGAASDPADRQPRGKQGARDLLARQFKNSNDALELVALCNDWVTG
ncbi:MAG: hypothetical protein ACP5MJ_21480 [Roseiflexus sp.]